jgi:NAD-dependent SIR2 family protein deacetylase
MGAKCKHECGLDDLTLCRVHGEHYSVQCTLCGAQWTTKAKYAQALAMDYSREDVARMTCLPNPSKPLSSPTDP